MADLLVIPSPYSMIPCNLEMRLDDALQLTPDRNEPNAVAANVRGTRITKTGRRLNFTCI
jgi:hypothetical protein